MRPAKPVAQLVSVHGSGDPDVLTVLAPVGPLDDEADQVDESRPHLVVVVGSGQLPYQGLLRAPCLGVLCPLLGVPSLPLQEQQGEGQPRPRADLLGVRLAPQCLRQATARRLVVGLVRGRPVPRLAPQPACRLRGPVHPEKSSIGLSAGTGQPDEGGGTFGGVRGCQAVSPRQTLGPPLVVVDARARHLCHAADHRLIGTPTRSKYVGPRTAGQAGAPAVEPARASSRTTGRRLVGMTFGLATPQAAPLQISSL